MRSLGWAQIGYNWYPYGKKKRTLGHRHIQTEDCEDGRPEAKERGLEETSPADTVILDGQPPGL